MDIVEKQRYYDNLDDKKRSGFSSNAENGGRRGFGYRRRFEGGDTNYHYGARTVFRGGRGGRYSEDRQPRRRSLSDGSYMARNGDNYQKPYEPYAQNYSGGNGFYSRNASGYPQRYRRRDRFGPAGGQYSANGHSGADENQGAVGGYFPPSGRRRRGGWSRRRFGGGGGGAARRSADGRPRRRTRSEGRDDDQAPTKLRDQATDDEAEQPDESATDQELPKPYTTTPPDQLPDGLFTVKVTNVPKHKSTIGLYNFMKCFGVVKNLHTLPPSEHKRKKRLSRDRQKFRKSGSEPVHSSENEAETNKDAREESKRKDSSSPDDVRKKEEGAASVEPKSAGEQDVDGDQYVISESYVAYVTFDNPQAANQAIRYNRKTLFGNKVNVHRYPDVRRGATSDEGRRSQKTGFGSLDEHLLAKMFESLDLNTRGQAQLVCRNWSRAMRLVYAPASDSPSGVKLILRSSLRKENQRERIKVDYDKSTGTVTLSVSHMRFVDDLCRRASRISAVLGGIASLRVSHLEVTRGLMAVLESLGDDVVGVSLEACRTAYGVQLGRLLGVARRLAGRLVVEDGVAASEKSSATDVVAEQDDAATAADAASKSP